MVAVLEVKHSFAAGLLGVVLLLAGCAPATKPALADSYFMGQALVDANGNGQVDLDDTPVNDATFIVTLDRGGEFGDQTDETGKAYVSVPGNVEYPVTVRMEAPEGSLLVPIGHSEIIVPEATGKTIQFLFSSK